MRSLEYRMDGRTDEVGALNIADFTHREGIWAEVWAVDLRSRGHRVTYCNWGVDNSGKLIRGKLENCNEDFLFTIDETEKFWEIKTVPYASPYYHFKPGLLRKYAENGAFVLVPKYDEYYVFGKRAIDDMLKRFKALPWRGIFGGKPAIRLWQWHVDEYVEKGLWKRGVWTPQARAYMEQNSKQLFSEKAQ